MLTTALKARIPVLRATTTDIVNLPEVLENLVGDLRFAKYTDPKFGLGHVFIALEPLVVDATMYGTLVDKNKTLLLINQEDESGLSLNCGEVPVPYDMLFDLVEGVAGKTAAYGLMVAFRGLTLKAASEIISMVRAQGEKLTIANVLRERSQVVGKLKGLALVDTATTCYIPNPELSRWVKTERPYFHGAADPRLIPRGLLFDGVAGTGKTQGSKFLARELGVPLYRLDMASSLAKWVGESEANFGRVLSMLDNEQPCVFLIDEVEKLFESGGEDAGTTSRILSQLLWWTAEHQSRILTVMTTNKREALPAELYRSGRIDKVMVFHPLGKKEIMFLATKLCESFKVPLIEGLRHSLSAFAEATPAAVTQIVYDHIKSNKKGLG